MRIQMRFELGASWVYIAGKDDQSLQLREGRAVLTANSPFGWVLLRKFPAR
jgi:hypothetical protein